MYRREKVCLNSTAMCYTCNLLTCHYKSLTLADLSSLSYKKPESSKVLTMHMCFSQGGCWAMSRPKHEESNHQFVIVSSNAARSWREIVLFYVCNLKNGCVGQVQRLTRYLHGKWQQGLSIASFLRSLLPLRLHMVRRSRRTWTPCFLSQHSLKICSEGQHLWDQLCRSWHTSHLHDGILSVQPSHWKSIHSQASNAEVMPCSRLFMPSLWWHDGRLKLIEGRSTPWPKQKFVSCLDTLFADSYIVFCKIYLLALGPHSLQPFLFAHLSLK